MISGLVDPALGALWAIRMLPLVVISPLPGWPELRLARWASTLALGIALFPFAAEHAQAPNGPAAWIAAAACELVLGIAIAIAAAAPRIAVEWSGQLVDVYVVESTVAKRTLGLLSVALFGVLGGWSLVCRALTDLSSIRPLGRGIDPSSGSDWLLGVAALVTSLLELSLSFALPGLLVMLACELFGLLASRITLRIALAWLPSVRSLALMLALFVLAWTVTRSLPYAAARQVERTLRVLSL